MPAGVAASLVSPTMVSGEKSTRSEPVPPVDNERAPAATTAPPRSLLAPRLFIELDKAADRFVHKVVDRESDAVLRRFPSEGQIAFSRGVNAYVQALRRA